LKKILFLTVILAFILSIAAFASDTRVMTMGNINGIVIDEANIWMYPHTINNYPKLFAAEYMSGSDFASVGVHMPWKDEDDAPVLGLYFYRNVSFDFGAANRPLTENATFAPNERLTLFYGTHMGDRPFGLAINYVQASQKSETSDLERSNFALNFIVSKEMSDNFEVGGDISFWSFTDKDGAGDDLSETSGNMAFDVFGRYWMDKKGKFQKVVHAGFGLYNSKLDDGGGAGELKYTEFSIDLGLGCNYQSTENILVVSDLGIMFLSDKIEDNTDTYFMLPYFKAGLDANIFKWLDMRAGVKSFWNMNKIEGDVKYNYVSTSTYLGGGLHWGNLEIDAQISPSFLSSGPYFISGNSSGDLASRFSLNYWFE